MGDFRVLPWDWVTDTLIATIQLASETLTVCIGVHSADSNMVTLFLYEYLSISILHKLISRIPLADIASSNYLQSLLSSLSYMYIIPEYTIVIIKGLLQDSVIFLLTLIFIFTPTFIANFGVVLVTIVLPAYKTSLILKECQYLDLNSHVLDSYAVHMGSRVSLNGDVDRSVDGSVAVDWDGDGSSQVLENSTTLSTITSSTTNINIITTTKI